MQPQIAGYSIQRELGRGGMATVFLAHQQSLQRQVAIKFMAPALASDEEFARRFLKEGPTAARLIHPNIVKVIDTGVRDGHYYLAMEYVPGGTLKQRIQRGLPVPEVLSVLRSIAAALGYAHQQGIVHRDVKAQNILLREDGTPVLSDFGIAKALGSATAMTLSGMSMGSPHYMSPEQLRGEPVDRRTDLYALGILCHEMLTGKVPYTAENSIAIAYQHVNAPLPRLPAELAAFQPVLDGALAKRVEDRFDDAEAMIRALERTEAVWREQTQSPTRMVKRPDSSRGLLAGLPARLAAVALITVLLGGTGFYVYQQQQIRQTANQQQLAHWLAEGRAALQREDFTTGLDVVTEGLAVQPRSAELLALRQQLQDRRANQQREQAAAERRRQAMLQEQREVERQRQREADRLLDAARNAWTAGEFETSLVLIERGLTILPEAPALLALRQQIRERSATQRELVTAARPATVTPEPAVVAAPPTDREPASVYLPLPAEPPLEEPVTLVLVPEVVPVPETSAIQTEIARLLERAEQQIEARKLTTPPGDNAHETFRQIGRLDGGRTAAEQGMRRLAELYLELARGRQRSGNLNQSLAFVDRGLEVQPGDTALLALREEIRGRQTRPATPTRRVDSPPASPPVRAVESPPASVAREPEPPRRFGTF